MNSSPRLRVAPSVLCLVEVFSDANILGEFTTLEQNAAATRTESASGTVVRYLDNGILYVQITSGGNVTSIKYFKHGTNGTSEATYLALATTNFLLPTTQWTPFYTNTFDTSGNFACTNVVSFVAMQIDSTVQAP